MLPLHWKWHGGETISRKDIGGLTSLLEDPLIEKEIGSELGFYFEVNTSHEIPILTTCEAQKAYIRGLLVKHSSRKKRLQQSRFNEIVQQIREAEIRHKKGGATEVKLKLKILRKQLQTLPMVKAKAALLRRRKAFYVWGNKSSRGLARSLKKQLSRTYISKVKRVNGGWANTSSEIAEEFKGFFTKLYNIRQIRKIPEELAGAKIRQYIQESGMPKLKAEESLRLEEPISIEEFETAVSELVNGKAPGPDGFTPTYYKREYWENIGSPFCFCFQLYQNRRKDVKRAAGSLDSIDP